MPVVQRGIEEQVILYSVDIASNLEQCHVI